MDFLESQSPEEQERMLKFYHSYVEEGISPFSYETCIFGEFKKVKIDLSQVLEYNSTAMMAKAITGFEYKQSMNSFIELMDAFYFELLVYINWSNKKETSPNSFLDADIGLFYIYTLLYLPEFVEKIEPAILNGLEYRKCIRDNNIREMKGSYGRDSILYLAYWLSKEFHRDIKVSLAILSYCKVVEKPYLSIEDNALSSNKEVSLKWFEELSEYHINKSKESDITYPFHKSYWIYFPVEIFAILKLREIKKIENEGINHPLFDLFLPYCLKYDYNGLSDVLNNLSDRIIANMVGK